MTHASLSHWKHRAALAATATAALAAARCSMETSEATSASFAEPVTGAGPIHPAASSALCLDVVGQTTTNGARVQVWSCTGNANQQWTYDGTSLRIYGNKCLDVANGNTANGAYLQIWDCVAGDPNQMWTRSGSTLVWTNRGKCVDLTDGVAHPGTPIQSWICTSGDSHQQWTFGASAGVGSGDYGPVHPAASSALCLDVVGQSAANGARVQVWPCTGNANQQWTYDGTSLRIYDGKCLDVTNGKTANGTLLQIWDCMPGDPNQMWTRSGSTLVWTNRGKCVDLTNGLAQPGTPIQSWSCTSGDSHQQWTFGGR